LKYFFVKDLVLSGMLNPGTVMHKVICCSDSETEEVKRRLKDASYLILQSSSNEFAGLKAVDWRTIPKLNK